MIDQINKDQVFLRGGGKQRRMRRRQIIHLEMPSQENDSLDVNVGQRLRELRTGQELSIRALAELSDLNVNTLSLIENGRTSPSVSTLQQLAVGLNVPITAFFESDRPEKHVVYQKAGKRPRAVFMHGTLNDLGGGLASSEFEPFIISLKPASDSGETPIVHTGLEFVYCLDGEMSYLIENESYLLEPGDSLLFEARLPHRWQNTGEMPARALLVICTADERDHPVELHFAPEVS